MMTARLKKHSLKFISLFLSIFLWAYVLNSEKVKFEKTVQLEYILPDEMIFASKPPLEVTFLIEGPRAFVRTVADREDRLVIDLNRANAKRDLNFQVDINPTQLSLPFGMVVERVIPRRISIKLEKRASKILPVKAQFMGKLTDQLSLLKHEIKPNEVEVYGPRSVIGELKELYLKPIDLETLVGQSEIQAEIALPDERLSVVGGQAVTFQYQLRAQGANVTLKDVPIKFLTNSRQFTSSRETVSMKVLIPEKILKSRSNISSSVQVWADVPENLRGKQQIPLRVILPPGVHLLEISPKSIVVNIK